MTREHFAELIGWSYLIAGFGILNIGAMLPQLIKILRTRNVEGLSLLMICIYLIVQVAFSLHGFFHHDATQTWSLGLSAVISLTIIVSVIAIRRAKRRRTEQASLN